MYYGFLNTYYMMNNKRILVVCTTDSMIWNFLTPHIDYLIFKGYTVECACSRTGLYYNELECKGYKLHEIDFERNPFCSKNVTAFFKLRKLIKKGEFDIIHCHEPVGGAMGRLAGASCRKYVMYFAHGFHFFSGAPKKHWFFYYTFEYILSFLTDAIVTICKEDYERAKKLYAKNTYYIHGIGVDFKKFNVVDTIQYRREIRKEYGVGEDDILLISVGEMIKRKNHQIILSAMKSINQDKVHLFICGDGELQEYLKKLSISYGIEDKIHFLGFRRDVPNVLCSADIFIFPSLWEGLGLAGLEAMYMGIPVIGSKRQGIKDYVRDGETGLLFNPENEQDLSNAINKIINNHNLVDKFRKKGKEVALLYSIENSINEIEDIYKKEGII